MSIYADKKNGRLTGRWCVEVQRNRRIMRARTDTLQEARVREEEFQDALGLPQVSSAVTPTKTDHRERVKPITLVAALEASQDTLWLNEEHRANQVASTTQVAAMIGPGTPLRSLTTEDFDGVVRALRAKGLTNSTLNSKLSAVRCVLKWCLKRHYIPSMPDIPFFKSEAGRVRWLTPEEEAQMIRLLQSYDQHIVADFVAVAIDTGMRRSELLTLEPGQVEKSWAHLWKTKSKVPRSIPLTPRSDAILETRRDTGFFQQLQKHTLRWYWDRAKAEMGLAEDKDFVVHALRHTCATRLVNDYGVDVFTTQKWMGHEALETTRRYVHINDASLARARALMAVPHTHQNYTLGEVVGEGQKGGGIGGGNGVEKNESGTGNRMGLRVLK